MKRRKMSAAKAKRSRAAKRGWKTRRARVELERLEEEAKRRKRKKRRGGKRKKKVVPPPPPPTPEGEPEDWDVTVHYPPEDGPDLDFSVRMVAKGREKHTEAQVRGAFWYTLLHGTKGLKAWTVTGFDWYKGGSLYRYEQERVDEVMGAATGVFKKLGIGALRVALVDV